MSWSHFRHEADLGLRGAGPTKAAAFEAVATALTAAVTDIRSVAVNDTVDIECEAPNDEILLVDWLNALVYEMAVRRMLFARFDVTIADGKLRAQAGGEPVDAAKHEPAVEVKGATMTALSLREAGGEWVAECVVDV